MPRIEKVDIGSISVGAQVGEITAEEQIRFDVQDYRTELIRLTIPKTPMVSSLSKEKLIKFRGKTWKVLEWLEVDLKIRITAEDNQSSVRSV